MTDDERTEELRALFESVTGDTSVVEPQREESTARDAGEVGDGGAVDAIEHHGFDDVIDGVEAAGSA